MAEIRFRKERVTARIRNPLHNFELTEDHIEIRFDPLLGNTTRIAGPKGLDKIPEEDPLQEFVANAKPCFFCAGRVENQTPKMPHGINPEGRIEIGEALLFPNLSGFARYSGVCIFSKEHFIYLNAFSEGQILNALKACRQYLQQCAKFDNEILYASVNGNYLLPAGSSILHPHLQPILDPYPTNHQRLLLEHSEQYFQNYRSNFWTDLKAQEEPGPRSLFKSAHTFFFTPFAPVGFNEIDAVIGNGEPFPELDDQVLQELSSGIKKIFSFYHSRNRNSFNLAIFSPPVSPDRRRSQMPCILKICTRPALAPYYRNDVTFFEKLHAESMIDCTPEQVAQDFRNQMS